MIRTTSVFILAAVLVHAGSALAVDKVVVVPLGSGAKGSNGQVQYNDNGKTAGADLYYDKATASLGVGTSVPSYLLHVKDARANWLVGIHNTSTSASAKGLLVRADGSDPFVVQTSGGSNAFAVGKFGNTYIYGYTMASMSMAIGGVFPSYTLTVNGTAGKPGGGTWSDTSDARLKKNIGELDGALEKITRLQPHTFEWVHTDEHGGAQGIQAGFLAQEVEKVFPAWVDEIEPTGKDKQLVAEGEEIKSVHFPHDFNAYLVAAIKELQAENRALKKLVCREHPLAEYCQ